MRVVVTGACGVIAEQLVPVLRERYDAVLVDVRDRDRHGTRVEGVVRADLLAEGLDAAVHFEGADAVVHLGYHRPSGADDYEGERLNVDMAERVHRLARAAGVGRVVVASSNHATDWYEPLLHSRRLDVIGPDTPPRSDNYYGWAKVAIEALGFVHAARHGQEVVQIRIGAPRPTPDSTEPAGLKRFLGAWISPRDLQQLVVRSIEASEVRDGDGVPFLAVYGISANTRAFWSITNARRVLGYAPSDDSELAFADVIAAVLRDGGAAPGRLG